jgi:peptide/nickel transport system permease protein
MSAISNTHTPSSRWTRLFQNWRYTPLSFRIGSIILLIHLVVAITGPFWAPYGFAQLGAGRPLSPMSWEHPFGVDQIGRDVFSRVIYGGHIVLLISISGTFLGLAGGATLGLLSGYLRGWFDEVMMRLLDALNSIPFLILALIAVSAAGGRLSGSPLLLILVIGMLYAVRAGRLARAAALDIVTRDFVTMAHLRGENPWSVMWRELLPNASGTLLVEFAIRAAYAPVLVGTLGFLGFGVRPPTPEWGYMISENRNLIVLAPITVIGPGLMLASLVVGLNLCTEGLARILGRSARTGAP